jgi:hypothetical protein
VADDDVQFIDITPPADGSEDVLVFGPRRRESSRTGQTVGVVLGLLSLIVGVLWAGFGTHEAKQSPLTARVRPASAGPGPGWHTIPIALVPTYTQQMRSLGDGELLVAGTPAGLPPTLAAAFGPVTGVRVQTVIASAGVRAPFVCRLTAARSGPFRIQVLAIGLRSGDCPLALHAPFPPRGVYAFTEWTRAGYDIQVSVVGPNPMSLMQFNGNPRLLDGVISST